MKIKLEVDATRITMGDLIMLEEGVTSPKEMRDFLARFVVNGTGEPIAFEDACAVIDKMTLAEVEQAVTQLSETMKSDLVPPQNGGS